MFQGNYKNNRTSPGVFIVNFEHLFLVFILWTLNRWEATSCVNIIIESLKMSRCFIQHHSKQQQGFSVTKFSKYLTASSYLLIFHQRFSSHLAKTNSIVFQIQKRFFLSINNFPSGNLTGRYILNGCFFDSLFCASVTIKQPSATATISTLLFLSYLGQRL